LEEDTEPPQEAHCAGAERVAHAGGAKIGGTPDEAVAINGTVDPARQTGIGLKRQASISGDGVRAAMVPAAVLRSEIEDQSYACKVLFPDMTYEEI
jgi:hypothetical protein